MPTHIVGWSPQRDSRYPVFYPITGATSTTTTVKVAGDVTVTLADETEEAVY